MRPISIRDVHPKIGDVLQTVSDFVVVELVDDGPNPRCHARSLRTGQPAIVAPGSIRGIMIPVFQEQDDTPFRALAPEPQPEPPVVAAAPPPEKPKGYEIVRPGPQIKREPGPQPPKRHHHAPPPLPTTPPPVTAPETPKIEESKSDSTPSITQEVKDESASA